MKLTENQKIVIKSMMTSFQLIDVVRQWELKHDRHLVVDEILELCSKMKVKVPKDFVAILRRTADNGK